MRNTFLSVLHSAMFVLALSLCSAPGLAAQASSPTKTTHLKRAMPRSNPLRKIKTQKSLPVIAEMTLNAPEQLPTEPQITFGAPDSYHSPVNFKLLLPPAQTPSGVAQARDVVARVPGSQFAEVADAREGNTQHDDPAYYARHVPVVGGLMLHVLQQSKAHPRVTRVLQVIHPEF